MGWNLVHVPPAISVHLQHTQWSAQNYCLKPLTLGGFNVVMKGLGRGEMGRHPGKVSSNCFRAGYLALLIQTIQKTEERSGRSTAECSAKCCQILFEILCIIKQIVRLDWTRPMFRFFKHMMAFYRKLTCCKLHQSKLFRSVFEMCPSSRNTALGGSHVTYTDLMSITFW